MALDAASHVRLLRRRVVDHLVDRVAGRRALDAQVAQAAVAELVEGAVADRQHALRQRPLARDREVPGEVEPAALEPRATQPAEDVLHLPASCLEGPRVGPDAVAVEPERPRRREDGAGGVAQVAQRDDVALALLEVLPRVDQERRLGGRPGVRVELGPDQLAPQRARVDDDDRLPAVVGARHVGDRHGAGLLERGRGVEARHLQHDRLPRREAVGAVVVARIDRGAAGVARHHRLGQRQVAVAAEVVARPREQAVGAAERVAAGADRRRGHGRAPVRVGSGRRRQHGGHGEHERRAAASRQGPVQPAA